MKKGMNNPAALAAVASTPGVTKTIDNVVDKTFVIAGNQATWVQKNAGTFLIILVGILGISFGPGIYRAEVAKAYARKNAGSPNLIAAAIIYKSIKRFEAPGFLSWIIPDFNYYTDESALYDVAGRVTSYKDVADAYYKMFNRILDTDVQGALDTKEMRNFYNILTRNSQTSNQIIFPVGSTVYCNDGNGMTINKATYNSSSRSWKGNKQLYGNFEFGEKIGIVHYSAITPQGLPLAGQRYYIVKDCYPFNSFCDYGVVVQSQITNKKLV